LDFISGFAWPVPRAFAGAVSACRFEQGDVLYSDAEGYGSWPEAGGQVRTIVQVLDPPKSARAISGEGAGSRFAANWLSPATIELTGDGAATELATTQGRLFRCLWHGELANLEADAVDPGPPAMQRDLHRQLEQAVPALRRRLGGGQAAGCLYLGVLDEAGDASRVKAHAIRGVLAGAFEIAHEALSPEAAGIEDPERFHPALRVEGVSIRGRRGAGAAGAEAVEALLKDLLYTPGEGTADRFALSRHGLLVPLADD
jgi:hypothetical protein